MDDPAQTHSPTPTYAVKVSGLWFDPRTRSESPHTETYRIAARRPDAAQLAAEQLFTAEAVRHRFRRSGACQSELEDC